jgi:hypothetical protein
MSAAGTLWKFCNREASDGTAAVVPADAFTATVSANLCKVWNDESGNAAKLNDTSAVVYASTTSNRAWQALTSIDDTEQPSTTTADAPEAAKGDNARPSLAMAVIAVGPGAPLGECGDRLRSVDGDVDDRPNPAGIAVGRRGDSNDEDGDSLVDDDDDEPDDDPADEDDDSSVAIVSSAFNLSTRKCLLPKCNSPSHRRIVTPSIEYVFS